MLTMKRPKFKKQNPRQRLLSGERLKIFLERSSINTFSTLSFSATLSTSCMLGLQQQQQKLRFKSGGSSKWEKLLSLTALDELLKCFPVSAFLPGKCERCKGGMYGNEEYDICRAENSPWMPIQTRGEFGNSNKDRAANKRPQTAVIASSDVLSFQVVFHLN
jgi:hypothetical protein